jgi:hypothetical protein
MKDRPPASSAHAYGREDVVIGNVVAVAVRKHVRHCDEDVRLEIVAIETVGDQRRACGDANAV